MTVARQTVAHAYFPLLLALVFLTVNCGQDAPSHECEFHGTVATPDNKHVASCAMDLYLEGRADRLMNCSVPSDVPFSEVVSFPIADPRSTWYAAFRCPGYRTASSHTFELGAGWLSCQSADLGTTVLQPSPTDGTP